MDLSAAIGGGVRWLDAWVAFRQNGEVMVKAEESILLIVIVKPNKNIGSTRRVS